MVALQNDRLRSMPSSFLPPSPVSKPGTDVRRDADVHSKFVQHIYYKFKG